MQKQQRADRQNSDSRRPSEPMWDKEAARFETPSDLDDLAMRQGIAPASDWDALLGDFWPEQESVDDFVDTVRTWRREADEPRPHR